MNASTSFTVSNATSSFSETKSPYYEEGFQRDVIDKTYYFYMDAPKTKLIQFQKKFILDPKNLTVSLDIPTNETFISFSE